MSDTLTMRSLTAVLTDLHGLVDELQGLDPTRCGQEELIFGLRELERVRRRLITG